MDARIPSERSFRGTLHQASTSVLSIEEGDDTTHPNRSQRMSSKPTHSNHLANIGRNTLVRPELRYVEGRGMPDDVHEQSFATSHSQSQEGLPNEECVPE